jgi:hypothetical protein
MQTPRSICSIHQVLELASGMWALHRVARRSPSSNTPFTEAPCPTCLQTARDVFQQQFPALYTSTMPLTRKAA